MRVDAEATTGQDRACFLGNSQNAEGGPVGEAVGNGKDLERIAKVQHFHVVIDEDGEGASRRHGSEIRHGDEGFARTLIGPGSPIQPSQLNGLPVIKSTKYSR